MMYCGVLSQKIKKAGDFNLDWLDGNGLERRQLYNIFETFGFTQNINVATSKHHHLLDYFITRKYCEYISNFAVSHFINDHQALHASVRCIRPHPFFHKRLRVRALRNIDGERLDSDLASFTVDNECVDVNTVVARYDEFLSSLLNKHAPLKEIDVVERPLNDWMTDNTLALKKIRRQRGKIWRQSPITINYDLYYENCEAVKNAIKDSVVSDETEHGFNIQCAFIYSDIMVNIR